MEATQLNELISEYGYERPRRGELLEGEILLIDEKTIFLDIGKKRDAIVPIEDLDRVDERQVEELSEGDQVPVVITQPFSRQGELLVSISKGLAVHDWERAETCLESGEVVELEVIGQNRGGVEVNFGLLRGFVPNSHLPDVRRYRRKEARTAKKIELIGTSLPVKAIEVDRKNRRLIFSARQAKRLEKSRRLQELEVGQIIEGRVVNLVDFGAFVDLGGVDGLIHVSEIAWGRVNHPKEFLDIGEQVEVAVKDVDLERGRVGLSRKPLLPDPWDTIEEQYPLGTLVTGTVTSVKDFGIFVLLKSGMEGLVHVSEMEDAHSESPGEFFSSDDPVRVKIIEIDPYRKRIGLSLRQVPEEARLVPELPEDTDPEATEMDEDPEIATAIKDEDLVSAEPEEDEQEEFSL